MPHTQHLSPIEDIIADAKQGKMFILVDDEQRENEGDLVIPANYCDDKAVNFMAKYGRGLICLALNRERVEQLNLPLMARHNGSRHETAFTISIEAREGVTTGISAADRARTIAVAIDKTAPSSDIVSPGHVFPLMARDGGVLVRAGHTEAAVDISTLAGLNPAGVICEIMNDDGSMARLPDLIPFAKEHNLKIATIADLIAYRRRFERLIERVQETDFVSEYGGEFKMVVYQNRLTKTEHIALVKGTPHPEKPTLVRMHALDVLHDVLAEANKPRTGALQAALRQIAQSDCGVLVLLRNPLPGAISEILSRRQAPADKNTSQRDLRDYGIGAQILLDLGVQNMLLLSDTQRAVIGLEGYGLNISGYTPLTNRY